jgi:hypothetical protein
MHSRVSRHIRANVVGYIALFVALSGTAVALPGKNTVDSGDIINGQVKLQDVAAGAVGTEEAVNESLTGADVADGSLSGAEFPNNALGGAKIDESSLGQVPSATVGGYGRSTNTNGCNPSSETYVDCGFVSMVLPQTTRVLVIGSTRAYNPGSGTGFGFCRLVTSRGVLEGTSMGAFGTRSASMTAVTPQYTAGQIDVGVECNEVGGENVAFGEVKISAVALSPS